MTFPKLAKVTKSDVFIFLTITIGFPLIAIFYMGSAELDKSDYHNCRVVQSEGHSQAHLSNCVTFMTESVPAAYANGNEDPLSHITTVDKFKETYRQVQLVLEQGGFKPMPSLEELTHGKLHSQN